MFASPTPSVLTADTLMTSMVWAVRFESVVLFDSKFTFTNQYHSLSWQGNKLHSNQLIDLENVPLTGDSIYYQTCGA